MVKNFTKMYNLIIFDDGTIYRELKNKCRLIKPTVDSSGYWRLQINNKKLLAHRVIMEAFHGKSELTVDHIDGNKLNNSLDNLEYVTQKENQIRSWEIGLRENQRRKHRREHKERLKKPVIWNGVLFESGKKLASEIGVSRAAISQALKRGYKVLEHEISFYNKGE